MQKVWHIKLLFDWRALARWYKLWLKLYLHDRYVGGHNARFWNSIFVKHQGYHFDTNRYAITFTIGILLQWACTIV